MELACERLYMRWADARARAGAPLAAGTTAPQAAGLLDSWEGEPPTEIVTEAPQDLLAEVDRGLAQADVLVVSGREWLADAAFAHEVESRVSTFLERGGRVE